MIFRLRFTKEIGINMSNPEHNRWKSCAQWPHQEAITTDTHDTEGAASAVCDLLERWGLGGEGKHFPIKTWVEPVTPNQCMGCQGGWPLNGRGHHQVKDGYPGEVVACTASRYE